MYSKVDLIHTGYFYPTDLQCQEGKFLFQSPLCVCFFCLFFLLKHYKRCLIEGELPAFFTSLKTLRSEQFSIDWPAPLRLQSSSQSPLISSPSCWSVKSLHFLCWGYFLLIPQLSCCSVFLLGKWPGLLFWSVRVCVCMSTRLLQLQ